jgi:WD40 repeat-containing protein SMU1
MQAISVRACAWLCACQVWDVKTSDCLRTFTPPQTNLLTDCASNTVHFLPRNRDQLLVCNRTGSMYIMSVTGDVRLI